MHLCDALHLGLQLQKLCILIGFRAHNEPWDNDCDMWSEDKVNAILDNIDRRRCVRATLLSEHWAPGAERITYWQLQKCIFVCQARPKQSPNSGHSNQPLSLVHLHLHFMRMPAHLNSIPVHNNSDSQSAPADRPGISLPFISSGVEPTTYAWTGLPN